MKRLLTEDAGRERRIEGGKPRKHVEVYTMGAILRATSGQSNKGNLECDL